MKPQSFKRLLKAVQQMKAIQRGEIASARVVQAMVDGKGVHVRRKINAEVWRASRGA
jgi:hypothetical protein